jgi:hypothetical protein
MTAKDKQNDFLRSYLKPLLKRNGYKINGHTWYKNSGDFVIIINLQNFSWNSAEYVDFCFNIGIAFTALLEDKINGKVGFKDLCIQTRENFYFSEEKNTGIHKNNNGYFINYHTEMQDFEKEIASDFETQILPKLELLKTIKDCVEFYGNLTFWGDHLKRLVSENNLLEG